MLATSFVTTKRVALAAALSAAATLVVAGCSGDTVVFSTGGPGGAGTTAQGGSGTNVGGSSTTSSAGGVMGCAEDCSLIPTQPCNEAVCNQQTGMCETVPLANATPCDDGLFCTVGDACDTGQCLGNGDNDCGMGSPGSCNQVTCDESSQTCSLTPVNQGQACDDGLFCVVNEVCDNGQCIGIANDCSSFPQPPGPCNTLRCDDVLNTCVADTLPNGTPCTVADQCLLNTTCQNATCVGTQTDCSNLNNQCQVGVCNMSNGQCFAQNLPNTTSCNDGNACTSNDTCTNGVCGGTAITQCINNDGCCPTTCLGNNDSDCACTNLAPAATGTLSSGGVNSTGYGPDNFNDGVTQPVCEILGCGTGQCFGWVFNNSTPNGAWIRYDWPAPVTISSMYIDANPCTSGCYGGGRTLFSGVVQYWDGIQWVQITTFTGGNGDTQVNFPAPVTTQALRVFDLATGTCMQALNSMIYEWYVYPGHNCTP